MPFFWRAEISAEERGPAPVLGNEPELGELGLHAVRVGLGEVDLVDATMIGTLASLAWSMASLVWGMTPSIAATTRTTMSVTCAAARIMVKASWPGRVEEGYLALGRSARGRRRYAG